MKNEELVIKKILKLLSKKDYSEKEIKEKIPSLTPHILKKLKDNKLIDDFSLSQKIIEKLQNKGKGFHYIFKELERRKIKEQIIEKLKKEYDFEKEFETCKKIVEKLKGKSINSIIMNLKSRGFCEDIIEKVINL